ncbi:hypothetical protein F8388_005943 [Cannabis sativa]|uniref:Reverse transcriptase zinc-binding domain-containing protein n=1 Tax=Cannabis sativa TaxID=3483 RepID=A0A7J6E1X4_CANSA|nr:hypothetical protein F8388_005943 [Cannabis sativa]
MVWRACSGCLQTNVQLKTKHVSVDILCPMCKSTPKTTVHVLVDCPRVQECWRQTEAAMDNGASSSGIAIHKYLGILRREEPCL